MRGVWSGEGRGGLVRGVWSGEGVWWSSEGRVVW